MANLETDQEEYCLADKYGAAVFIDIILKQLKEEIENAEKLNKLIPGQRYLYDELTGVSNKINIEILKEFKGKLFEFAEKINEEQNDD